VLLFFNSLGHYYRMINQRNAVILAITLTALTSNGVSPANATTPSAGKSCAKAGTSAIANSMKFTCVNSGKKLIWNTGTKVSPAQSNSPSRTTPATSTASAPTQSTAPMKTELKAPIPIALPVTQTGAVTFANGATEFAKIPETAWNNVQSAVAANESVKVPITLHIGPNTNTTEDLMTPAINREFKMFNGFMLPPSYTAVTYSAADEPWAEKKWIEIGTKAKFQNDPAHYINHMHDTCNIENNVAKECYGGYTTTIPGSDAAYVFYGVQNGNYWSASSNNLGPMTQVAHELTHTIQFAQFIKVPVHAGDNTKSDTAHRGYPCWFAEGQANAIGIPLFITTLPDFLNARDGSITRGAGNRPISLSDYSAASFTKFLTGQKLSNGPENAGCYNPSNGDYQLGYSVGYAATEALVAIGGPQSTMALVARTADGDTWEQAFEKVYGISWTEGATALGKILAAEYAVKPLQN
jgi:hypothetical protein